MGSKSQLNCVRLLQGMSWNDSKWWLQREMLELEIMEKQYVY